MTATRKRAKRRAATIEDLEQATREGRTCQLRCPACGLTYSAHVGDYFWARPGHAFRCGCRGRPGLELITR